MNQRKNDWTRRRFLQTAGTLSALAGAKGNSIAAVTHRGVSLVVDPSDPIAGAPEAQWAARELEKSLAAKGVRLFRCERMAQANAGDLCVVAAGLMAPTAVEILRSAKVTVASAPEALAVAWGTFGGRKVLLATGFDALALVYALLDLSDRVQCAAEPAVALVSVVTLAEQPANQVRSNTRLFTSNVEDLPWYNDHEMWPKYLTMLATQRFNRFNLAFGIGYDFIRSVTDAYFLFTYPFLLKVPGYDVRVPQLPDAERDANLAMLKFISEQTVARGLEFHVGLWMHGYEWINSPNSNYTIEGVTKGNHGAYCRDAVRMLLQACPAISGVTFRIHGESGVTEGSYEFWKTVFDGVATCGRTVKLDMHTKGMDETMTQIALNTKQPVNMSPKFWAEHMGMPYHQTDIRVVEMPKAGDEKKTGLMRLSAGTRSFLRYGYGDLMREDRPWTVVHRIWPGTQRVLLWGDPVTAASYSRSFSFCGSNGVEWMEPLSFKGRRGSGHPGGRCAYQDVGLSPRWDWEKYEFSFRVWGRLLYNPDAAPNTWERSLQNQFGAGAKSVEAALANASRILPIITTAYAPSAGNNTYMPELYWNQSFVDKDHPGPYGDSLAPKVFNNASPLDPLMFSRMNEYAAELLGESAGGKYSPVQVAQWIEGYASQAKLHLKQAEATAGRQDSPEYRRFAIDVAIQIGLGHFFGAKFRSGVLFAIFEQTNDKTALQASLTMYRKAREYWAQIIEVSKAPYMSDITIGEEPQQRGHWSDRIAAMDKDIAAVAARLDSATVGTPRPEVARAIQAAMAHPEVVTPAITHAAPKKFKAGQPLELTLTAAQKPSGIRLFYRHVNQAERYKVMEMEAVGGSFRAAIPAGYTMDDYSLEYYFEVISSKAHSAIYPGFAKRLSNQPYFVVRRG